MSSQYFYYNAQTPATNGDTSAYGVAPEQFPSFDYPPLQHLAGTGLPARPDRTEKNEALLMNTRQVSFPPKFGHMVTDNWCQTLLPDDIFPVVPGFEMMPSTTLDGARGYQSILGPGFSQEVAHWHTVIADGDETVQPSEPDPFAHIDLHILNLVAMGFEHGDLEESCSHFTYRCVKRTDAWPTTRRAVHQ